MFGQDDPKLFANVRPEPIYNLPFPKTRGRYLLVQGVGGQFSHKGSWAFDWSMPVGVPILAARDGVVISCRGDVIRNRDLPIEERPSNFVRIRHEDGSVAAYVHLDTMSVVVGQRVRAGEAIGGSGNTGYSTQPHLHFHVERDGKTIPIAFRDVDDTHGIPRVGRFYP